MIYQTMVGACRSRERPARLRGEGRARGDSRTRAGSRERRYEEAVARFVEAILDPARRAFLEISAASTRGRLLRRAQLAGTVLVKITAPASRLLPGHRAVGLQPRRSDNRRPVDFATAGGCWPSWTARSPAGTGRRRRRAAQEPRRRPHQDVRHPPALACRRAQAALFAAGRYRAARRPRPFAEHACRCPRGRRAPRSPWCGLLARRGPTRAARAEYWADTVVDVPRPRHALPRRLHGERLAVAAQHALPRATCSPASRWRWLEREGP